MYAVIAWNLVSNWISLSFSLITLLNGQALTGLPLDDDEPSKDCISNYWRMGDNQIWTT